MIRLEKRGYVQLLMLDRPDALNALNTSMLAALAEALECIAHDESVRAIVITGQGKAFAAGADIAEMKDFAPDEALAYAKLGTRVFDLIENLPQPVIAAVNGYALGGGCELALSADIRLASEKAKFGQPEVSLGITPGFGGTQRLFRAVGMSRAMELIFTGKTIDAAEALRIGLASTVFPPEALLDAAMALAESIARNAPFAVRAAKRAMRDGCDLPLSEGIASERERFSSCFATADQKMAMAAFVEKRKPEAFEGK